MKVHLEFKNLPIFIDVKSCLVCYVPNCNYFYFERLLNSNNLSQKAFQLLFKNKRLDRKLAFHFEQVPFMNFPICHFVTRALSYLLSHFSRQFMCVQKLKPLNVDLRI